MSEPKFRIDQEVRFIDGPPVLMSKAPVGSGSVEMMNPHGWCTVRKIHRGNDGIYRYDCEFEDDRERPSPIPEDQLEAR